MSRDTKLIVLAVVLLVVAVALIARHLTTGNRVTPPPTQADIQKQITQIQNDPHMPAQAKAIAIGQIKARSAGYGAPGPPK